MGQAKLRGTLEDRVNEAKEKIAKFRPAKITCNQCQADINDIHDLNIRNMPGIEAAFAGQCTCGHSTFAVRGDPQAVAALMEVMQDSYGHGSKIAVQKVYSKG